MRAGSYKVTTNNYIFDLNVLKMQTYYNIYFGDPNHMDGACVELSYDTDQEETLKLDSVTFDKRCSKDKQLEKGKGTQEMVKAILKICVDAFPKVKRVVLNDVSSFECNGKDVWLFYYYLMLHGSTWYELQFGAKIVDKHTKIKIDQMKELLLCKPKRSVFSFYEGKSRDSAVTFETWHDYFKAKPCAFFLQHQKEFERKLGVKLVYSTWKIKVSTIRKYNIVVSISKTKKLSRQNGGYYPAKHCIHSD